MAHHVMIDLETLGLQPNAAVVSLGAVKFDMDSLEIVSTFSCNFRLGDQQKKGRLIDADTVRWWMQQSDEARSIFGASQEESNEQCLTRFNAFCLGPQRVEGVWGFGAAFDNVVLTSLYDNYNIRPAWNYRQNFCFRTFNQFFATQETMGMTNLGTVHNALDDAQFQTDMLLKQIAALRTQGQQSLMLGRLLGAMSGMLSEQATAEDLMTTETDDDGTNVPGVEEVRVPSEEGGEGDGLVDERGSDVQE